MALKIFVQGIVFVARTAWKYMVQIYIVATAIVILMLLNGFGSFQEVLTEGNTIEYARAEEVATTTVPEVVQIAVEIDWTEKRIKEEIAKVFPEASSTMIRVARCESGLVATATGPTNDHGIFQLHMPSHRKEIERQNIDVNNPADNIRFARYLYDNGGLGHWRASRGCWSK